MGGALSAGSRHPSRKSGARILSRYQSSLYISLDWVRSENVHQGNYWQPRHQLETGQVFSHNARILENDVIQYIVDGEVFYEIREGDSVMVEMPDGSLEEEVYCLDCFPAYTEGWFGFRMVRSHHIYSDFRVYRLEPVK